MATTKDSNKLTIYKGEDEDYAFIPLDVSESTYYDFTNSIIQNDASVYMKNIKAIDIRKLNKMKLIWIQIVQKIFEMPSRSKILFAKDSIEKIKSVDETI